MDKVTTIGLDLAKTFFVASGASSIQVHGVDESGRTVVHAALDPVRRRRGRKRARGSRTPMPEAAHPNALWSPDFLADSFGASRRFRILAVIDDYCRENLCLTADTSISGARVARELDALVRIGVVAELQPSRIHKANPCG